MQEMPPPAVQQKLVELAASQVHLPDSFVILSHNQPPKPYRKWSFATRFLGHKANQRGDDVTAHPPTDSTPANAITRQS